MSLGFTDEDKDWAMDKVESLMSYRYGGEEAQIQPLTVTCTLGQFYAVKAYLRSGPLVGSIPDYGRSFVFEFTTFKLGDDVRIPYWFYEAYA